MSLHLFGWLLLQLVPQISDQSLSSQLPQYSFLSVEMWSMCWFYFPSSSYFQVYIFAEAVDFNKLLPLLQNVARKFKSKVLSLQWHKEGIWSCSSSYTFWCAVELWLFLIISLFFFGCRYCLYMQILQMITLQNHFWLCLGLNRRSLLWVFLTFKPFIPFALLILRLCLTASRYSL